jgi:hypothetical protein
MVPALPVGPPVQVTIKQIWPRPFVAFKVVYNKVVVACAGVKKTAAENNATIAILVFNFLSPPPLVAALTPAIVSEYSPNKTGVCTARVLPNQNKNTARFIT